MKKLSLEELVVDSFVTSSRPGFRGTVAGHQDDTNSVWTQCQTCGTQCTETCTDTSDEDERTMNGITCNVTCVKGQTDCGTCAPDASCDLQYGCGGTSYDYQAC